MPDRHRACDSAPARQHGRHAERNAHGQPTERRRRTEGACRRPQAHARPARGHHHHRGHRHRRRPVHHRRQRRRRDGPVRGACHGACGAHQHLPGAHVRRDGRGAALRRRHVPVRVAGPGPPRWLSCRMELHHVAHRRHRRRGAGVQLLLQDHLPGVRRRASRR